MTDTNAIRALREQVEAGERHAQYLAQVLTDISEGRGAFGVDPAKDLEWTMWEAGRAVAVHNARALEAQGGEG